MLPKRCQLIRKLALSQVVTWESLVLVLFPLVADIFDLNKFV